MRLGVIDLGTNSIHLLIGILGLDGAFHVLLKERELVRIGDGGLVRHRLTATAMRRAASVLRRYARLLKELNVSRVEAVATSAVRDARNGEDFVRYIRRRLGVPLRIISGKEEARLIHLGIMRSRRTLGPVAIVTIGGGSAQVIVGDAARARYLASVPLGGARLAQQFIRHDPPTSEELASLHRYVKRVWAPMLRAMRRHRWRVALGSSATIYQLMVATRWMRGGRLPDKKHQLSVTRTALRGFIRQVAGSTAAARRRLPGLDPKRQDLALPTAVALLAWMEGAGVTRLACAPGSLRERLIRDYMMRLHAARARWTPDMSNGNGHARAPKDRWPIRRLDLGVSPISGSPR